MAGPIGHLELSSGNGSTAGGFCARTFVGVSIKRQRLVRPARRHGFWRLRSVRWRTVVLSVQWGSLLVMFFCTLVPYLVYHSYSKPRERAFVLYDADISRPSFPNTVAGWMAPVFPFIFFVVTAVFGEFYLVRLMHSSLTSLLSAFLFLVVDSLLSYWVTLLCTEVLKYHVGFLRPDFLVRCDPDVSAFNGGFVPAIGSTAVPACRSPPSRTLEDGHYSFPSGHASASANFEFYLAVYFLWTVFFRRCTRSGANSEPLVAASRSGCGAFWHDVGEGVAVLWIILNLGVTWAISATRVTDNKHRVADVVAGMFLGGTIATVFALRAIPRVRGIMERASPGVGGAADINCANMPAGAVV